MKTSRIVLLGSLLLLAVAATEMAWQSYWKARWLEAEQVGDVTAAALE